jgi:two-component system NtrC family sensor kinase
MRRLRDLSYRVKLPLAISAVILLTEVVVTATLVTRAYRDARTDLEASARSLTAVLARSLRDPLVRDDLWQAFEVVRTPVAVRGPESSLQTIVVLDAAARVFVSSDPGKFAVATDAVQFPASAKAVLEAARKARDFRFVFDTGEGSGPVAAARPIVSEDGELLGTVLLAYDAGRYFARVRTTLAQIALISIPGLLVLIPLGWYWGRRIADPLGRLAAVLSRVGTEPSSAVRRALPAGGHDEIGAVSAAAAVMLDGLARKEELEREVLRSERLAAVGRVSAAIAHEINNPLGGMLNALDTAGKHGRPDPFMQKTLALIERGLQQIRSTVGALLVEARLDSPALTAEDWDDLKTLIQPQLTARRLSLDWDVACAPALPLPAHQIRQLVLNLLLNGAKAADEGGRLALRVAESADVLSIEVANTGPGLPAELRDRLFEPFIAPAQEGGRRSYGLGLWVCYQIVRQLAGTIEVGSDETWTRFRLQLPLPAQGIADSR